MNQYQRADEIAGVDQRIARHVDNQVRAQKQAGLEQVSQQAGAILSSLRRYQALSNMQAAARLQATLGLEPTIDGSDAMPLPELTAAVAAACRNGKAENCHDSPGRRAAGTGLARLIGLAWALGLANVAPATAQLQTTQAQPASALPAIPAPAPSGALEPRDIRAQLAPRQYTTLAAEIGASSAWP